MPRPRKHRDPDEKPERRAPGADDDDDEEDDDDEDERPLSVGAMLDDEVPAGEKDTPGLDEADATHVAAGHEVLRPAFEGEPAINAPGINSAVVEGVYRDGESPGDIQPGYYVVDTSGGTKFREGPFPSSPSAEAHMQAHYGNTLQTGMLVAQYGGGIAPGELSDGEFPPREGFANPNFEPPVPDATPEEATEGISPL